MPLNFEGMVKEMNGAVRAVAGLAIIVFGFAISLLLTFGTVYFTCQRDFRTACSGGILAALCWTITILNLVTFHL